MVKQEDIRKLMEGSKDTPEIAETGYLAARELSAKQIDRNLRLRHGSGQAVTMFKEKFNEISEYDGIGEYSYSSKFVLKDGENTIDLDEVTPEDVGIGLDQVIKNAFIEEVVPELRDETYDNLEDLSRDAKIIAYLSRKGYDLGIWSTRDEPSTSSLWKFHSIITGDTLTDPMKNDIIEELVSNGCFYESRNKVIITPAFAQLEDPYKHLPRLELKQPD